MISPYKLTATPEDIDSWAKSLLPGSPVDNSLWREGAFPVVSRDLDSASPKITWMFQATEESEHAPHYVVSAGLLPSDVTVRDAFRRRRCLILVSALRVKRTKANEVQELFALRPADEPLFALAGVWGDAMTADGTSINVFSAIMIRPSILLNDLFTEMPVIVAQADYSRWLRMQPESSLPTEVLRPLSAVEMKRWIMLPEGKLRSEVERSDSVLIH